MYLTTHISANTSKTIFQFSAYIKTVYTDYKYTVLYECDNVRGDGTCDPPSVRVGVFSRTLNVITDDDKELLGNIVHKLCVERGDFIEIQHEC